MVGPFHMTFDLLVRLIKNHKILINLLNFRTTQLEKYSGNVGTGCYLMVLARIVMAIVKA